MVNAEGSPVAPPPLELLDLDLSLPADPDPVATPELPRSRWILAIVLAGALLAGLVCIQRPAPEAPAHLLEPPPSPPAAAPEGLLGYAELYVAAYLTATGADGLADIRRFYPAAPDHLADAVSDRYVTRAVALASAPIAPGYWEVEVAATVLVHDGTGYLADGTHHYLVALATSGAAPAATSLPMRIAPPAQPALPAVVSGAVVEDGAIRVLVDGFLQAFLVGGDLRPHVAVGSPLATAAPVGLEAVAVRERTAVAGPDGTHHVRAVVDGIPASGAPLTMEYHLVVGDGDGTWKVLDLIAGPPTTAQVTDDDGGPDADQLGDT